MSAPPNYEVLVIFSPLLYRIFVLSLKTFTPQLLDSLQITFDLTRAVEPSMPTKVDFLLVRLIVEIIALGISLKWGMTITPGARPNAGIVCHN